MVYEIGAWNIEWLIEADNFDVSILDWTFNFDLFAFYWILLSSNDLNFEIECLIREYTHINWLDLHIEHSFIFGDTAQGLEHSTHTSFIL